MDKKSHKTLEAILLKGAKTAGFPTNLWTCPRVAEVIGPRFGVCYHAEHIGRSLHSFGWNLQEPVQRTIECGPPSFQFPHSLAPPVPALTGPATEYITVRQDMPSER